MPDEELTRHLILATAGQVDHGKTALVKALTGTDTDRLPEEKQRGITIELGFAHLALPGFSLGVIDVPGHENFVRNMIAGIGAIDLALLVVAADDGWMAQTEEHLQILEYLGVRQGVVAITKSDLAESAGLPRTISERLGDSFLARAPIVVTSVKGDSGFEELKNALVEVCARVPPPRDLGKPRLSVDRVFTIRGSGTVVTGTLAGGELRRGETIFLQPQNRRARIRALQSHNRALETALPGTRTAINLSDFSPDEIPRGSVVTTLGQSTAGGVLDVRLERSPHSRGQLRSGMLLQLLYGSARFIGRITLLDRRELLPGAQIIGRIVTSEPIFAFAGDRFILRDPGARRTIAGGTVLDPDPAAHRFRSSRQRELLGSRAQAPQELDLLIRTQLRRDHFIDPKQLLLKSRFSAREIADAVAVLVAAKVLVQRGNLIADAGWWNSLIERASKAIDGRHAAQPNEPGVALIQLRSLLPATESEVFDALIEELLGNGFSRENTFIRRRSHRSSLPPHLAQAGAEIRLTLERRRFDPPSRKELARTPQAEEALRFFLQTKEVVRLSEEVVLSTAAFAEMKERIAAELSRSGGASASELRRALGTTRRVLIPLLEQLDRDGLTKRQGDRRVLRAPNP